MKRLLHPNSIRSKLTLYLIAVFLVLSVLHWRTYYVGYQDWKQLGQLTQEQGVSDAASLAALAIDSLASGTARVQMAATPSVLARLGGRSSASQYLCSICQTDHNSLSYSFLLPSGRVVASSSRELIGADLSASEDVRLALDRKFSVMSNLCSSGNGHCFAITTPVRRGGELKGLMRTEIRAAALARILAVNGSREAMVVAIDRQGAQVYESATGQREGRDSASLRFLRGALSSRGHSSGPFSMNNGDNRVVASAAGVRMGGWRVVAARSISDEAHAGAYFTRGFLYSLVFTAGILVAFWWKCGVWLTGNLRRLARAASALAVGDLGKRIHIRTGDELESLSDSFNRMAESLQTNERQSRAKSAALQGLLDVSRVVTSSLDLDTVVAGISQAVSRRFGAVSVAVYICSEDTGRPEMLAFSDSRGDSGDPPSEWQAIAAKAHKRRGLVVDDSADSPNLTVAAPLVASDRPAGVLIASLPESQLAEADSRAEMLDLLQAFASHCAVALQNAQAYARAEEYSKSLAAWLDELSALRYVTEAITASLDLSEVLQTLARLTSDVMKAQCCAIMLLDSGGQLTVGEAHNLSPALWQGCACRIGEPFSGIAAANKGPATCRDLLQDLPDHPMAQRFADAGMRSFLSVPLIFGKEVLGSIDIWMPEPTDFTAYQTDLLSSIAAHSAMVIQNARLFGKEYRIAEALQSVILANIPSRLSGVELGCKYVAALDEAHVGGDFYDAIPLPGGKLGIVIADVSGKGLNAAVHTAMGKYMLRGFAYHMPDEPARVLEMVNDAVRGYGESQFYISIFYCVIDPITGEMVYANAGHPPAIWISDGGLRQSLLYQTGMPCGLDVEAIYQQKRVRLETDDMLVLYTDGLMDARSGSDTLGIEGLQNILFSVPEERDPQALVELLHTEAMRFAKHAVRDDIAVIAIRACDIGRLAFVDRRPDRMEAEEV